LPYYFLSHINFMAEMTKEHLHIHNLTCFSCSQFAVPLGCGFPVNKIF
jgi:hypothetical protein